MDTRAGPDRGEDEDRAETAEQGAEGQREADPADRFEGEKEEADPPAGAVRSPEEDRGDAFEDADDEEPGEEGDRRRHPGRVERAVAVGGIRSYEPGEDWWWCYADELFFEIDGAPPSPSHP